MIKFIDNLVENDTLPVDFQNEVANRLLSIRLLVSGLLGIGGGLFCLLVIPIILPFSIINNILIFINNKFLKGRVQRKKLSKIEKVMNIHQEELDKDVNYRLAGFHFLTGMPLNTFIGNFVTIYRNNYDTINKDNNIICDRRRRRSLGDIYLICKTYYPNCTIHDVIKILIDLLDRRIIAGSYCGQINKFVFHTESSTRRFDHPVEYTKDRSYTLQEIKNAYENS